MSLLELNGSLIVWVWPAERVVAGLCVSKFVRAQLRKNAEQVVLRIREPATLDTPCVCDETLGVRNETLNPEPAPADGNDCDQIEGRGSFDLWRYLRLFEHEGVRVKLSSRSRSCAKWLRCGRQGAGRREGDGEREGRWQGALSHLDLSRNGIGNAEVDGVMERLGENLELEEVNLSSNALEEASVCGLESMLRKCTSTLTNLNLGHNTIGDKGTTCVAKALESCTALRCLDLGVNQLSEIGTEFLGAALVNCTGAQPPRLLCGVRF